MKTEKTMRWAAGFITRYYLIILIAASLLTAVCFPRAVKFFTTIDTDLTKLLPQSYKSVQTINEIRKKFKSTLSLIIVLENDDPVVAKEHAIALADYLETDPEVSTADLKKPGYEFFDKHKLLFIDLEDLKTIRERIDRRIQKEKLGGLYIDFESEEENSGNDKKDEFNFGDLEEKYKSKYSSGARSPYNVNDEGTVYAIHVHPKEEADGIKGYSAFYDRMRDDVVKYAEDRQNSGTKIYYTGSIRTRVDEYNTIINDLKRAGLISSIGIFLVLLVYFRRPLAAAFVFLPLGSGILISFAFSSLFIESLNLVTSFLFAILGGLGVEVGIHMLARYIEERRKHPVVGTSKQEETEDALFAVLHHTGVSAFTSAATVAATFFVLIINDFKGFSEFGFIAGFGLTINFIIFMFVFPSLLVLMEKIRLLNFRRGFGFGGMENGGVSSKKTTRFPVPAPTLAVLGVMFLAVMFVLPKVEFEWRFSKIKANIQTAQEAKSKQRETTSSVNSPAAVIIHNREEAKAIKKAIDEIKAKEPKKNVVDAFKSYYDIVSDDQGDKMAVVGEMKKLLADKTLKLVKGEHKKDLDKFKETLNETTPITESEIPNEVREIFKGNVEGTGSELAYINPNPKLELDNGKNAISFAEQIEEIKTPVGTFYPSSDAIVFADVLRTMISDGKRVVVMAFIIVLGIVWLDFRKFSDALLVISPIVLGIIYMFGIMYVMGIQLNFYNIVVIPTAVGTSIDNSIHLYHRYREMGSGSIMRALASSGSAALTSSLTNILGFLGLVFTSHSGLKSIGTLAVAGLVGCLITTLIYFPALLQVLEDRKTKSAGQQNN